MNKNADLPPDNLRRYLLIRDAATYLGVSAATLRNWERAGKLAVRRHPINGYRLYEPAQLDEILAKTRASGTSSDRNEATRRGGRHEDREPAHD